MPILPDYIRNPRENMNSHAEHAGEFLQGVVHGQVPHDRDLEVEGIVITLDADELVAIEHHEKLVAAGVIQITRTTPASYPPLLDDSVDPFVDFHARGIEAV